MIAECSHSRVLVVRVRAQGGMNWNDTRWLPRPWWLVVAGRGGGLPRGKTANAEKEVEQW